MRSESPERRRRRRKRSSTGSSHSRDRRRRRRRRSSESPPRQSRPTMDMIAAEMLSTAKAPEKLDDEKLRKFNQGTFGYRSSARKKRQEDRKHEQEAAAVIEDVIGRYAGGEETSFVRGSTKMVNGRVIDADEATKPYEHGKKQVKKEREKILEESLGRKGWKPSDVDAETDRRQRDRDRDKERGRDWDRDRDRGKEREKRDRDRDSERDRDLDRLPNVRQGGQGGQDQEVFDPVKFGVMPSQSTTLLVTNLGDKTTADKLAPVFGAYGALGGIAVRTSAAVVEAKVCFMTSEDAVAAYQGLFKKYSIEWAQPSRVPPFPWYIHLTLDGHEEMLRKYKVPAVKVDIEIPQNVRSLIDIVSRCVVKHGVEFEEAVKSREALNPAFAFMRPPHDSKEHVYYRWRVFSLYQGDNLAQWRTVPFQMFLGGAVWFPPECGELRERVGRGCGSLSLTEEDKTHFFKMLRGLKGTNESICSAMMFCMEHASAASELAAIVTDALSLPQTAPPMKLHRLHLVSDILYNSGSRVPNASLFRIHFQENLPRIFAALNSTAKTHPDPAFKAAVINVLRVWSKWQVYPEDFVASLSMELN